MLGRPTHIIDGNVESDSPGLAAMAAIHSAHIHELIHSTSDSTAQPQ